MANKLLSKNESGQVLVILVFVAVVIFLFGAVMIDLGQVSCTRIRLQNAADATALAIATYQARGLNAVADLNAELALGRLQPGSTNKWEIRPLAMTGGNSGADIGWHFNFMGPDKYPKESDSKSTLSNYLYNIGLTQRLQEAQVKLHRAIIDRIGYLYLASNLGNLLIDRLSIDKSKFEIGKEGLTRKKISFHYAFGDQTKVDICDYHWHKYIKREPTGWDKYRCGPHLCSKCPRNWRYTYFRDVYKGSNYFMNTATHEVDPEFSTHYLHTHHYGGCGYKEGEHCEGYHWEAGPNCRQVCTKFGCYWVRDCSTKVKSPPHPRYYRYRVSNKPAWLEKTSTPPLYAQVSLTLPAQEVILGGKILGITVPPISAVARAETYGGSGDKDGQMWNEYETPPALKLDYPNQGKPRAHFKARLVSVKGVNGVLH